MAIFPSTPAQAGAQLGGDCLSSAARRHRALSTWAPASAGVATR